MYRFQLRAVQHYEWESFDRRAALVQEFVTSPVDSTRWSRPYTSDLPCIVLESCQTWSDSCPETQFLISRYLRCFSAQSPLQCTEIRDDFAAALAPMESTIMSFLRTNPPHITRLILVGQPLNSLSDVTPLKHLGSLELRCMSGIGIDVAFLRRIGSLPHFRSFTADSTCFSTVADIAPPLIDHQVEPAGFFEALTQLHLEGNIAHTKGSLAAIPSFLRNIATKELRSRPLPPITRGFGRGQLRGLAVPTELHGDILHTIAERWAATL
ncbi:hypothetical protein C8F04DRAFT_1231852, partial [Mycena alexandri]